MSEPVSWRPMDARDLDAVARLADRVHVQHPEAREVFAERLRLYPAGCRVLVEDGAVLGYVLSHPWRADDAPALNSLLGRIPPDADTYYLHDVALLPEGRGKGHAARVVEDLAGHAAAAGFTALALVAVNGSQPVWEKWGFRQAIDAGLAGKLASYGGGAVYMRRGLMR